MAVPGDVAELPLAGEAAELAGAFEQSDALSALCKAERHCHSENATAHDAPVFFRVRHALLLICKAPSEFGDRAVVMSVFEAARFTSEGCSLGIELRDHGQYF